MRCSGPDDARPAVESAEEGGKRRIVICTNRIENMSGGTEGASMQARANARINLAMARAAIERDRNLSEDQKAQALAGIAQAEMELTASKD